MCLGIFQSEKSRAGFLAGSPALSLFLGLPSAHGAVPVSLLRPGLLIAHGGPAFFSVGFRVAWLVVRPLCHWAVVIAGATTFATAALVALFIAGAALWIYNPILTRLIGRK